MALKVDYKDPEFVGEVKYQLIHNGNGTVSFIDKTEYIETDESKRDYINATFINMTNQAINSLANQYSLWVGSFTPLKENYKNATFSGNKEFQLSQSGDIISLTDMTTYTQVGDVYSSSDINTTNNVLNTMGNSYDNGLSNIKNLLKGLGASHVDDLSTALTEMIASQTRQGEATGIKKVQDNPSNYRNASNTYNLCTEDAYIDKAVSNQLLWDDMTAEKNILISNRNAMQSHIPAINAMEGNALDNINDIQAGRSIAQAEADVSRALTSINNIYNSATTTITEVRQSIESSRERLGNL